MRATIDAVEPASVTDDGSFCHACGKRMIKDAAFCHACGTRSVLVSQVAGLAPVVGEFAEPEAVQRAAASDMTLKKALLYYFGSLGMIGLLVFFAVKKDSVGLLEWGFFGYLGIGFFMTKKVMGGLMVWHPMYDTLANVTTAKLRMFALWPFDMGRFLFSIVVNRIL